MNFPSKGLTKKKIISSVLLKEPYSSPNFSSSRIFVKDCLSVEHSPNSLIFLCRKKFNTFTPSFDLLKENKQNDCYIPFQHFFFSSGSFPKHFFYSFHSLWCSLSRSFSLTNKHNKMKYLLRFITHDSLGVRVSYRVSIALGDLGFG